LSSREIIGSLFSRTPAGRYGSFEHFWPETLRDYWPSQGYPKDADPAEHFGFDILAAGAWVDTAIWRGRAEVLEETDEWRVTRDGRGAALKYWKKKSGTPEHIGFEVVTPEAWGKCRDRLLATERERIDFKGAREGIARAKEKGLFCVFGNMFVFEHLRATLGDEVFLPALLEEPEWIRDFCDVYLDFFKRHYALLFAEGGIPDGFFVYEDFGFRNGLFCSPRALRELILPYHRQLLDFLKSYGLKIMLHSCGDIRKAIPIIVEAGYDCLQPLEAKAGCNVVEIARNWGEKLCFMGNIDVTVLNRNDKEKIRQEVEGKVKALKGMRASYIFHSDHSVPPDVSYESYRFALETFRACAGR
jgi:uroporphyrinogen decarboxylase